MPSSRPRVTIGMPIYNEERFLKSALESLLAQDYGNIQIVISDNASTDGTAAIGQQAAREDDRIRYFRCAENIGAAANFRRVADMADGDYFMWAAGHDEWSTNLISQSVAVLEDNADAAIAFATSYWIDEAGERQDRDADYPDTRGKSIFARFFTVFWGNMHPVLSVMRTTALQKTKNMQSFAGADLVLLSDMILMGDFVHAANASWNRRDIRVKESHSERMKRYTGKEYGQARTALDRKFPLLRLPFEILRVVLVSSTSIINKILILTVLLPAIPIRYVVGRRKANHG